MAGFYYKRRPSRHHCAVYPVETSVVNVSWKWHWCLAKNELVETRSLLNAKMQKIKLRTLNNYKGFQTCLQNNISRGGWQRATCITDLEIVCVKLNPIQLLISFYQPCLVTEKTFVGREGNHVRIFVGMTKFDFAQAGGDTWHRAGRSSAVGCNLISCQQKNDGFLFFSTSKEKLSLHSLVTNFSGTWEMIEDCLE